MNFFRSIGNFFSNLFKPRTNVYRGDGTPSSIDELDGLRGMHEGRVNEQLKFALDLKQERLNKPTYEYFATKETGVEPTVVPLPDTAEELKAELFKRGGHYYTGRVKTYEWGFRGKVYFNCLAEHVYRDRRYGAFIHGWQGPNYCPGYHSPDWLTEVVEGPVPIIQGTNYIPS